MLSHPIDAAAPSMASRPTSILRKPRLRGWIHLYCAYAALVAGSALVAVSWAAASTRAGHATLAYTLAIVAMFAVSATYHRVSWGSTAARNWMRRLDHSMIFVFIAGTYTPFALLDMPPSTGRQVLAIVWGGALAGVALTLFWPDAPRWLGVALYLLLGWVLRTTLARPVACDLRLSRDISRINRCRCHLPLRGGQRRGVLREVVCYGEVVDADCIRRGPPSAGLQGTPVGRGRNHY
jgi:channel protein (hemolysin III family)